MPDMALTWEDCELRTATLISSGTAPVRVDGGGIPIMGANGSIGATSVSNFEGGYLVGRVGAAGAVQAITDPVWASDNTLTVKPRASLLDGRFLGYLLRYLDPSRLATQTVQPLVTQSRLGTMRFLRPSLPEQRRIAGILNSIDDYISILEERVQKLEKLREGLVADLLARPDSGETRPLGKLSDIGAGVTLGSEPSGPGTVARPYLRVANVQDGYLDLREVKYVRVRRSDIHRFELRRGDVLMNEGGDADKLGRGTVWEGQIPGCLHQNHVFRVRCNKADLNPQYLSLVTGSAQGKRYFLSASKQTTNLATINSEQLKRFPVPVRSLPRQLEIVDIATAAMVKVEAERRELAKVKLLIVGLMGDLLSGRMRAAHEVVA